MYKVDPNSGLQSGGTIGQGGAQIFDLSSTERSIARNAAAEEAKKAAKLKAQQAIQDDIQGNLAKMGQIAIMPKDQQMFADDATKISGYVKENIDKLKSGDINSMMEFQGMFGNYMTKAEQSKNFRESWQQRDQMIAANPGLYSQKVKNAHLAKASTADAGNWIDDASIYNKTINYQDRIMDQLRPYAESAAQQNVGRKDFTLAQSEKLIEDDLRGSAELMRQASDDFELAKEQGQDLGAKDPIDYYKKLNAEKLVVKDRTPIPEYYMGGDDNDKTPKVAAVVKHLGEGRDIATWEYTNPADNPFQQTGKGLLRPSVIHREGGKVWMEAVRPDDKDGEPGETVMLTPEETHDFVHNKLQTTVDDLFTGNAPKHIKTDYKDISEGVSRGHKIAKKVRESAEETRKAKLKEIAETMGANKGKSKTITPAEFDAQWSKLPKGQSLVGPDGKTYTKK